MNLFSFILKAPPHNQQSTQCGYKCGCCTTNEQLQYIVMKQYVFVNNWTAVFKLLQSQRSCFPLLYLADTAFKCMDYRAAAGRNN